MYTERHTHMYMHVYVHVHTYSEQWNPSIPDTLETVSSVLINYILGEVLYNVAGTMHGVLIKGVVLISGVSLYMYNTHAHSYCIQIHSHTYTYMYCS